MRHFVMPIMRHILSGEAFISSLPMRMREIARE